MIEEKIFFYSNQKLHYTVKYKQQKNLYLKIENQKIIISAPFFIKSEVIENFIVMNLSKIIRKLQNQAQITPKINLFNEPFIYILDKKLNVSIKYQKQTKLYLTNESLVIYTNHNLNDYKYLSNKINIFLKQLAYPIIETRLRYWERVMQLETKKFNLRLMKTKWGVCFHQTKIITLNYKLIHFSTSVINYVLVHELAHLVYPNHTKEFWSFVAIYCPDYNSCRKILKYSSIGENYEKN